MDTRKEDADVETAPAPEAPARPAPGAVPLAGPYMGQCMRLRTTWMDSRRPSGPCLSKRWSLSL